jgi:hypothetical protein
VLVEDGNTLSTAAAAGALQSVFPAKQYGRASAVVRALGSRQRDATDLAPFAAYRPRHGRAEPALALNPKMNLIGARSCVTWVGGGVVISAMSAPGPRVGVRIFDRVGARRKLDMVLACADDGVTYGCRSLTEGVLVDVSLFELMDSVPPPQPALLGGAHFVHTSLVVSCGSPYNLSLVLEPSRNVWLAVFTRFVAVADVLPSALGSFLGRHLVVVALAGVRIPTPTEDVVFLVWT